MGLSRDESREIAALAIGLVIFLRFGAGILQGVDEVVSGRWTAQSVFGRVLTPVGATMGMLTLALTLLLVLSPNGSMDSRMFQRARWVAIAVTGLGMLSVGDSMVFSAGGIVNRLWFSALNGSAAAVLGASSWWILAKFDSKR